MIKTDIEEVTEKMLKIAKKILLIIIAISIIPGAIFIYYTSVTKSAPTSDKTANDTFVNANEETVDRVVVEDKGKKYYTFLATATDKAGNLTDVMMVARLTYADEHPRVSILQIPRDTYVKICAWKLYFGEDGFLSKENFTTSTANAAVKINEVYYHGKNLGSKYVSALLRAADGENDAEIEALCNGDEYKFLNVDANKVKDYSKTDNKNKRKEIENNIKRDFGLFYLENLIFHYFGIPIDYSAQVNIAGFRGVVDAIGGVDLYVPQDMYYNDPYQGLYIDLKKGEQHLDGEKAEQFVRFRRYTRGDIDRLEAQKTFMKAFFEKLLSLSTLGSLDEIIKEVQTNLYTNISFNDIIRFADKVMKMDLNSDITMVTLPGHAENIGGVSYYITNKAESIVLINSDFNVFDKELLPEDFKMLDSSEIVRPKVVVPPAEVVPPVEASQPAQPTENIRPAEVVETTQSEQSIQPEQPTDPVVGVVQDEKTISTPDVPGEIMQDILSSAQVKTETPIPPIIKEG